MLRNTSKMFDDISALKEVWEGDGKAKRSTSVDKETGGKEP
jgi:hypothetical protein